MSPETPSTTGERSQRGRSCCCSTLLRTVTKASFPIRTASTSTVAATTSASGRDCTSAWARHWPGWKRGWPSKRSSNVGPTGKSTTPTPNVRTPQAFVAGPAYPSSPDKREYSVGRCQRRPRGEREVQVAEPSQDVGRLEGVAPPVRRSMLGFTDRDVRHPVQDALDRDPALDSGQRRTGAGMHAAGERHVFADVLAVQLELVRVLEPARVTIGRTGQHHHDRADRNVDAADGGRLAG